jgi:hypothetical protein
VGSEEGEIVLPKKSRHPAAGGSKSLFIIAKRCIGSSSRRGPSTVSSSRPSGSSRQLTVLGRQ